MFVLRPCTLNRQLRYRSVAIMLDNSDINRFGTYLYSFSSTMYDEFYFNHTVGDFLHIAPRYTGGNILF